jgi:hypothetical protein
MTSIAARVDALNQTPWNVAAQLRRLNRVTANQPTLAEARLIALANLIACIMWLAKSEGVERTCDILDTYANRLIEDQAEVLSFEA